MDYTRLTRPEILGFIRDQEKNLFDIKLCPTPARPELILEITGKITKMMEALDQAKPTPTPPQAAQKADNYGILMRQQSLRDVMRLKKNFNPGNDVNQFITSINKAYTIHVMPELANYPSLETEFVKAAKDLLDHGIFQQMADSGQDTSTFEQLKAYLIATHGSQMTNFQHLSRAWDLQRRDGEKLTDFAGRLENTIREAAVHIKNKYKKDNNADLTVDTLFSVMGAMLMSEKVKTWNPNLYPHLVKTMDNHYTASGIACEAQRYIDRGIRTDDTTSHDNAYYTHRPQRWSRGNTPIKPKQPLRTSEHPPRSQWTNTTTSHNRNHYQTHRGRDHNQEPTVCWNYTMGRACFHGQNCPFRHPPLTQAHVATTDKDTPSMNTEVQDFRYEPDEI